jgi:hypothetical protein
MRARLWGFQGHICFQWALAYCGLPGNKREDVEAKKAAGLGPDDRAQRGRVSFEMIKGLIRKQVKGGFPNHQCTSQVYCDFFRRLQGVSRREDVMLAQLTCGHSVLLGETQKRVSGALWGGGAESPRRQQFWQRPSNQKAAVWYFQEVFKGAFRPLKPCMT